MARLKGPCLSISADGKFADTMVFASWKGIKYARQYVIPANPNTADQQTQRGFITAAVSAWHHTTALLNALDKTNLDRGALYHAKTMSGFNYFCKNFIDTRVAGTVVKGLYDTTEASLTATGIVITADSAVSTADVKIKYGTSPTALVNVQDRDEAATPGTTHTFTLTGLSASTTYYYTIYASDSGSKDTLGIGKFTTPAA